MGIISWIVLGFIAGTLAKILLPGRDRLGCVLTILVGVAGALVGGYIGTMLGWGRVRGFDLRSLGIAILGSVVVLILYRAFFGRKR